MPPCTIVDPLLNTTVALVRLDATRTPLPRAPQEYEKTVYDKLKAIATYCGEDFDPTDPSRILRVVRDFMRLFEKSLTDIRVRQQWYMIMRITAHGGDTCGTDTARRRLDFGAVVFGCSSNAQGNRSD